MNTVLIPILLLVTSVAAMGCAYSALPTQRWWQRPLPQFPAHTTAAMSALVALRGWIELLGALHGSIAWFSTLALPLAVLFLAVLPRSRRSHSQASVEARAT